MRFATSFLLLLLFPFLSFAQEELDPVDWSTQIESVGPNEYLLVFTAKMDKNWTVYSQFTSDEGPVPTSLNFESEGYELIGKATEEGHKKEGPDPLFDGVTVIKYLDDQPLVIKQKIKTVAGTKNIAGYLNYMTCDNERCLPPTDVEFDFDLSSVASKSGNSAATAPITAAPAASNEVAVATQVGQEGELAPVTWDISAKRIAGQEYLITYKANMTPKWNVYSQHTSDEGPVPTSINYEEKTGITLLGDNVEKGHKKAGPDPLFDGVNVIKFLYDEPFIITQKIKADPSAKIKGYLNYMTCNDEGCLPPTDVDFAFDFSTIGDGGSGIASATAAAATDINSNTASADGLINQVVPSIKTSYENPDRDCGGEDNSDQGLLWSFVLGFLGGLLALLTPCVFPMIPLTVSYFTKDSNRSGLTNGILYGISIIVIYVAMGLLLTSFFGEEALNALSTNWIANTIFFLIFIFFAFSFFGYYEITLPSSWTTKTDSMSDKGGILGIFFMAFTLALVSFSCTGPIIGASIVAAASNAVGPAVVMFGFALALALPFGFFAAFPSWLKSLPRSGGWMTSVKVILGFLELAFAFKFLSVADMTSHWGFLKYELFMAIWVLVAIGMALYLFGIIRFPHDSKIAKLSNFRKSLAIGASILALYLASGFMVDKQNPSSYMPKGLTSGIAPPANYNFFLAKAEVDPEIKKKYISYTKCANNIPCFKDYYEGLSYAQDVNKPVFLDFTGHGCVNCRKTEEFIWVDPEVKRKLEQDFVLISLYVDDREKLATPEISARLDKNGKNVKMRTVGSKWADFQIVNFKQNSQPLYVMMTNRQKVVSNPRGYRTGIDGYLEYMNCGLEAIKEAK